METVTFKKSQNFKKQTDRLFSEQKQRILKVVPIADIQHVGGTSVPDLLTKGDLDINVRVNQADFRDAHGELEKIYDINQPKNWTDTFESFKDDDSFELPVGVQLTQIDSDDDDFVKHRDRLLRDRNLMNRFNRLKMDFEGKDMESYREAKAEFFKEFDTI